MLSTLAERKESEYCWGSCGHTYFQIKLLMFKELIHIFSFKTPFQQIITISHFFPQITRT